MGGCEIITGSLYTNNNNSDELSLLLTHCPCHNKSRSRKRNIIAVVKCLNCCCKVLYTVSPNIITESIVWSSVPISLQIGWWYPISIGSSEAGTVVRCWHLEHVKNIKLLTNVIGTPRNPNRLNDIQIVPVSKKHYYKL